MPPRIVKRGGSASAGTKRTARSTRGAAGKHVQELAEDTVKVEDPNQVTEADNKPVPVEVGRKTDGVSGDPANQSKFLFSSFVKFVP